MEKNILVVDDIAEIRELMVAILETFDATFDIDAAENGEQALSLAEKKPPRAMLVDVRMPGMDGFELCRRIRQKPACKKTAILFMSGYGMEPDIMREGIAAGGDDFFVKPIDRTRLFSRLTELLYGRQAVSEPSGVF